MTERPRQVEYAYGDGPPITNLRPANRTSIELAIYCYTTSVQFDRMYENLRSNMIAFCDKTKNDKDCHEKFYEDIESSFLKDLHQYNVRVHNAYLSRLITVEVFFNKYNGKYFKETITSSKRAKELYDKIVDYFPNNKYVTELKNKITKKIIAQSTIKSTIKIITER